MPFDIFLSDFSKAMCQWASCPCAAMHVLLVFVLVFVKLNLLTFDLVHDVETLHHANMSV